jgi:5-methylcytosine-specific restriction protein A
MPRHERKRLSRAKRLLILARDKYRCQICSKRFLHLHNGRWLCEVDHMLSLANGGSNDMHQLRCLCSDCHMMKSTVDNNPAIWEAATGLSKYFAGPLASTPAHLEAYYASLREWQAELVAAANASISPAHRGDTRLSKE